MEMNRNLSLTDTQWLCHLAVEVGDWIRAQQANASVLERKANNTPLADVDVEADKRISRALALKFSGIPILSEEGAAPDYSIRKTWSKYWLVDPLDGTKEYLAQRQDYTVNIALICEGAPVFGVVYAPGSNELFWTQDNGAFKQAGGLKLKINSLPQVGAGDSVVVLESRSHPSPQAEDYLKRFNVVRRVGLGSSLKICRLAEGEGNLYPRLGPTMEWDIAAADAVYRASGREGPNFSPLCYNKSSLKNPSFVLGVHDSEPQPL